MRKTSYSKLSAIDSVNEVKCIGDNKVHTFGVSLFIAFCDFVAMECACFRSVEFLEFR